MRITVPPGQIAVLMSVQLAQELYSLCTMIRKTKRLKIEPPIHVVAGDTILALLESEEILVIPRKGDEQ